MASPGKHVGQGVDSIELEFARVTWKTSLASSGWEICFCAVASSPEEATSAATPAVVGVAAEVEPSPVGTLNSACAP